MSDETAAPEAPPKVEKRGPLRVVLRAPGERLRVRIGETSFFVRPITRQFYAEVDADLAKTFPDGNPSKSDRERAIYRRLLQGVEGAMLSDDRPIEWAKGCPICDGKGRRPDLASAPSEPSTDGETFSVPACAACLGSGDVRDFFFVCLPSPTWERLTVEAMRQFRRESDRSGN